MSVELIVLIVILLVAAAVVYFRLKEDDDKAKGKNATPKGEIPELNPEVARLLKEGYPLNEAIEIVRKRGGFR